MHKKAAHNGRLLYPVNLYSALYLAGTQASGAGVNVCGGTVYDSLNTLYIGLPRSVCTTVGVRHLDSESNALSAYITFCHEGHLLC